MPNVKKYAHDYAGNIGKDPTYRTWASMKCRCSNGKHESFEHYGGRGISVCARWDKSFAAFLEDMGPKPGSEYSIDRIDVNGNYEPGNCRWATMTQQLRNRRFCVMLTVNGETHNVTEWAELKGIRATRIYTRLRAGWTAEDALFAPKMKNKESLTKYLAAKGDK